MKILTNIINVVFWNVFGVTPITLLVLSREIPGFFAFPLTKVIGLDD